MAGTAHDVSANRVVACTSCHTHIDPAHLEEPEEHPVSNPEHMRADSVAALCTTCHAHPHTLNMFERDPHQDADLSCLSCHRIHDNKHAGLLVDEQTTLCYSCHPSARADFAKSSRHPVEDGVMNCSDCTGQFLLDIPFPTQPFVVSLSFDQIRITEIGQRRIIDLYDIHAGCRDGLRLASQ